MLHPRCAVAPWRTAVLHLKLCRRQPLLLRKPAPVMLLLVESHQCTSFDTSRPQVLSNDEVTAAVDLWALGCIIFQMLIGKAPFKVPPSHSSELCGCSTTVHQHSIAPQ